MLPEAQEQLLRHYEPLLHRVLVERHVQRHDRDYEDYLHDLYIKLVALAERFDGDPLSDDVEEHYRFIAYAHVGLDRYLVNILRHDCFHFMTDLPEHYECQADPATGRPHLKIDFFLDKAAPLLTRREKLLVKIVLDPTIPTVAMRARLLGVSTQRYHEMKKNVARKLMGIKQELE